jgi:hypothetical protein
VQVNSPECASARQFLAEQLAKRSGTWQGIFSARGRFKRPAKAITANGDGLYLRVKSGGKLQDTTASGVFRYTAPSGKRREFGMGATDRSSQQAAGASLTRAREKAEDARKLLDEKPPRDPSCFPRPLATTGQ